MSNSAKHTTTSSCDTDAPVSAAMQQQPSQQRATQSHVPDLMLPLAACEARRGSTTTTTTSTTIPDVAAAAAAARAAATMEDTEEGLDYESGLLLSTSTRPYRGDSSVSLTRCPLSERTTPVFSFHAAVAPACLTGECPQQQEKVKAMTPGGGDAAATTATTNTSATAATTTTAVLASLPPPPPPPRELSFDASLSATSNAFSVLPPPASTTTAADAAGAAAMSVSEPSLPFAQLPRCLPGSAFSLRSHSPAGGLITVMDGGGGSGCSVHGWGNTTFPSHCSGGASTSSQGCCGLTQAGLSTAGSTQHSFRWVRSGENLSTTTTATVGRDGGSVTHVAPTPLMTGLCSSSQTRVVTASTRITPPAAAAADPPIHDDDDDVNRAGYWRFERAVQRRPIRSGEGIQAEAMEAAAEWIANVSE